MVEVYGVDSSGRRFAQSGESNFDFCAIASMSYAKARVTTSASKPSITARACAPEPPCDWLIETSTPVFFFQYSLKSELYAE